MSTSTRVRPTPRGLAAIAVAVVGVWLSVSFEPRSLNAVVLPVGVAVAAAVVQLLARDRPSLSRTAPPNGFPGDRGTVSLDFETDDPFTGVVVDALPPGVEGDAAVTTLVGGDPVTYEVTYRRRGEHPIGPVRVRARDVLGLAERTFRWNTQTAVVVYPTVHDLPASVHGSLRRLSIRGRLPERGEFDHLREYTRGDSLRDVHWTSSAKRDDLVVKEFAADRERAAVTLVASADHGCADEMAEAAASIGTTLLHDGVPVSLVTPDGRLTLQPGESEALLEHLARVGSGRVEADADADVVVEAGDAETVVRLDDETTTFARLRRGGAGAVDGTVAEEVSA